MIWDVEMDCTGLLCPLPVLKAQKRLHAMAPGQILALLATDAMAAVDLPHFCDQTGHVFLEAKSLEAKSPGAAIDAGVTRYLIRRKST